MGRFMPRVWQQAGLGLAEPGASAACPSHPPPVPWAPELQGTCTGSQPAPPGCSGAAGGLHFGGFPCSPAPSWGLGMVRGRAEGSKGRGRGAARELWVIICY